MPPPRPATEARSGSLEPGRPSWALSANTRHPAGRPAAHAARRPDVRDRRQTDRRQTASSLNAAWAGHNNAAVLIMATSHSHCSFIYLFVYLFIYLFFYIFIYFICLFMNTFICGFSD